MATQAAEQPLVLHNWNLTEVIRPAKVVEARSVEDVKAVARNRKEFPSPVLAVGALHSVNGCLTNDGGTLLNMTAMNQVLGLEAGGAVRVQAGVKMAALYDWLGQHDLELSFCPEIGDATVGSLAVCTSKDSSIDGPGYLSALLLEVKYVDENGALVTLTRSKDAKELVEFTCSYGMMGVVVEVVLETRRRIAVTSRSFCAPARSGARAVAQLRRELGDSDAVFAIMVPDRRYVYLETRKKAGKSTAFLARVHPALSFIASAGENDIARAIMVKLKYKCFLEGSPPGRKTSSVLRANIFTTTHFRRTFTNSYPALEPGTPRRLDFSYFEFDMPRFDEVVAGCWDFHAAFKARTGFGPAGYAIYFVRRGYQAPPASKEAGKEAGSSASSKRVGRKVAPAGGDDGEQEAAAAAAAEGQQAVQPLPAKPYGNYCWGPGVSFMLDPLTGDADNPMWPVFNEEYTAWAVSLGAIPSLSQTKGLKPGQASLPQHLTRERFLTPYYAAYVK